MSRSSGIPALWAVLVAAAVAAGQQGCAPEDEPLAPYGAGGRLLSAMTVEDQVFSPRVTWLGGYVTVFGVNRGIRAGIDSTLVWLVHSPGNTLRYPVTYGNMPQGALDLTSQFGGTPLPRLEEDDSYCFWVMKEDAWSQAASLRNVRLQVDSSGGPLFQLRQDTAFVSNSSHMAVSRLLDVYINIRDVVTRGRLGVLNIVDSDTTNRALVTFRITEAGVTDTLVSAIGLVEGTLYDVSKVVWEVISVDVRPDTTIFWKNNVIRSPLRLGDQIPGTAAFVPFPTTGLKRGQAYYLWIANSSWNQVNRGRTIPGYAEATFFVW